MAIVLHVNGGSSPRMRGAPRHGVFAGMRSRIIPADAGSTAVCAGYLGQGGDHPRGCGEHLSCGKNVYPTMGSSPRMRGAPRLNGIRAPYVRIIPADAGSTPQAKPRPACRRDHPRGCGEHISKNMPTLVNAGSSPRMRGALHVCDMCMMLQRIIPADAGSTLAL